MSHKKALMVRVSSPASNLDAKHKLSLRSAFVSGLADRDHPGMEHKPADTAILAW